MRGMLSCDQPECVIIPPVEQLTVGDPDALEAEVQHSWVLINIVGNVCDAVVSSEFQ